MSVSLLLQTLEEEWGVNMLPQRDALQGRFLYFQTKYREYQEQFLALRQCYLQVECAWCKTHTGWKRKTAAVPGETSHGICPSCATDLLRRIPAAKRRGHAKRATAYARMAPAA